jgi:predicted RND superfamily exporter protein
VEQGDLPETLVSRMRAPDGTLRIQVFPREDLRDAEALERFVAEVRTLEPNATGLPVHIVEFGRYTASSLRQAFLGALAVIALLLLLLWRRPMDVILALAPVTMAALLSVASMALLDRPFNFANVIVLPLLLGVGVDSGIHLVRRAHQSAAALSDSVTARAVFYSAITTTVSFGSLGLADHPGVASLGLLLVIGMLWTLACNLIMLPALLVWTGRARS